jgi:hypothetical protein
MKPGARSHYHARLWPACCRVNGWKHDDKAKRREIVVRCMAAVRAPSAIDGTSHPLFCDDETTALFTYLAHRTNPADLNASARWVQCQEDYRTFNRAHQADWHETSTASPARRPPPRARSIPSTRRKSASGT